MIHGHGSIKVIAILDWPRQCCLTGKKFPDLLCYHCQQAAEKQLKAVLLHHKQPVKKTHDLEELLDLLKVFEHSITVEHYNNALKINDYSILMRYPGLSVDQAKRTCWRP